MVMRYIARLWRRYLRAFDAAFPAGQLHDIGSVIGAGLNLVGGIMGSDSAEDAANIQAGATEAGIAEQRRQYDLTRQDQAPFRETGLAANRRLASLLGIQAPGVEQGSDFGSLLRKFGLSDLEADPVYQTGLKFGLNSGTNAINQRAIAGGGYNSGGTLKALTRYATDYGNTKANESYNRFTNDQTNIYNRLAGISGAGQTATNQIASAGANMANNVTDLTTQAGNARAAGVVGGANAWGNAFTGAGNAYQNSRIYDALTRTGGGGYAGYNPSASYLYGTGGLGD